MRKFHYRWAWHLQSSPEVLWPFVSDTNRFNRDTGVPAIEVRDGGSVLPNLRRRLRLEKFGIAVEWEEEPFEWTKPSRYGIVRRYSHGPVASLRVLVELTPSANGGTDMVSQVWAEPRGWFGRLAIPIQIGWLSGRAYDAAIRRYDREAAASRARLALPGRVTLAPGGEARLAAARATLVSAGADADLVARLIETLEKADEFDVVSFRPYALADAWGRPRRAVLELCLLATRAGLLELRWKLLCPLCRGARESQTSLRDIQSRVHCDSCGIDFTASFEQSVELTFRPVAAVREVAAREFCVGGPQLTPHIVAQQLLAPMSERVLSLPLEAGRYRVRAPGVTGGLLLSAQPGGVAQARIAVEDSGWPNVEIGVSLSPALTLVNSGASERLFILERRAWTDQAATAAEVIALQIFRDLFATEALRPGEEFAVGSVAIVFTDLRSSTQLYSEIGDATAFGTVLSHFDVVKAAIAAEGGAVVKTIGDAVMAVFTRPAPALRAILAAQRALAAPADGSRPLALKAGVHYGPSIAVTQNDRLDYFGSTINIAARLEPHSSGADVIVSSPVRDDPEVAAWVATARDVAVEPMATSLKGFDDRTFALWRVKPA